MAYRRKTTSTRRKATPVRRRRRSMGQRVTTAGVTAAAMSAGKAALGGLAAAVLTNMVAKANETYAPYAGLVGSLATSLFLKQPEIAAGMAGYAGAKIGQSLVGADSPIGEYLAENSFNVSPSMYLQGDMSGTGIYASNYTLAGYEVPGL
jgi:hypothetical protein